MRAASTLLLLALALGLALYVWLVEIRGDAERERSAAAEKRVLALEPDEVVELELPLSAGQRARLVRGEKGWELASPITFRADERAVERALDALAGLDSELTLDAPPEGLEAFGLSDGERRAVAARTGERSVRLYLGENAPVGSLRYFALEGDDRIHAAERSALDPLAPSLFSLRDKRLTLLRTEDVAELQVRVRGSLVVTAVRAEDAWRLVAPEEAPADAERIERVLDDLVLGRASEFIDEPSGLGTYGLDFPEMELSLARADGAATGFALGQAGGTVYVRVDDARVLYAVPERLLSAVPRHFFDYRYKRVLELDPSAISRIELSFPRDDVTLAFAREQNDWVPEDASLKLEPFAIEDLLYALRSLDASALEPKGATPGPFGLSPPSLRVTAYDDQGTVLGWLELGDIHDSDLAARSSQTDRIWQIPATLADDLPLGRQAFQNHFLSSHQD